MNGNKKPKKPNQLLQVASLSLQVAQAVLQPYSHPKSPHKFVQAQLLSCLVLRAYLKTTYRGVLEVLELSPPLQAALQLKSLLRACRTFLPSSGLLIVQPLTSS